MENAKAQGRVPATMAEKFKWLKGILRDKVLTEGAKNVATALYTFHNQETGRCDPSQAAIGDAVNMHRQAISGAVRQLRESGWITTVGEQGSRLSYILNVGRAVIEATDLSGQEDTLDAKGVSATADRGVSANPDRGCPPSRTGGVRQSRHVTTEKPPTETTRLNPAPAEAASASVVIEPADERQAAPIQPATILPVPANDDDVASGWVEILGLKIPSARYREWETAFPDLDLRSAILSRAKWAAGITEKRPGHRMQALQTELDKLNTANRQSRLDRKEAKQADAEAGIERCPWTGRDLTKMRSGTKTRFQW